MNAAKNKPSAEPTQLLASCSHCGLPIPRDAPSHHCPACLLEIAGLDDDPLPAPSCEQDSNAARRIGGYLLGRQLGGGGMGVVYEARHLSLNRTVAIKLIRDRYLASPTLVRRFMIEAEAAARLNHPNIVAIHDVGESDGQRFFTMDLVEGESLRDWIERERSLDPVSPSRARERQVQIARLVAQTARAVHHAHQHGVLHRDLKPANVLIDSKGQPFLTDFGLAKFLMEERDGGGAPSLTGSGDMPGTPSYMAPETVARSQVTEASDIYGLGAILYEMLTRRPPFRADTPWETVKQVAESRPRNPRTDNPWVSKDLDTICMKCLEKDPRSRYATAEVLADDLDNWLSQRPIKARPAGAGRRTRQWIRRNPAGAALIASLLLAFLLATVLLLEVRNRMAREAAVAAAIWDSIVDEMEELWEDPETVSVFFDSYKLSYMDNRTPSFEAADIKARLGIICDQEPYAMAQGCARFLGYLEQAMAEDLGEPVNFGLMLFKRFSQGANLIKEGEADFMVLSAVDFVHAKLGSPEIIPVGALEYDEECVVFAHRGSGVQQLEDLAGRTVVFPDPRQPMNPLFKAMLVNAGITRFDLSKTLTIRDGPARDGRNILSERETVNFVAPGAFDASVTLRHRFEWKRHERLVELDHFEHPPDVFVARAGLEHNVLEAFREAMRALDDAKAKLLKRVFPWRLSVLEGDDLLLVLEQFREKCRLADEFDEGSPERNREESVSWQD